LGTLPQFTPFREITTFDNKKIAIKMNFLSVFKSLTLSTLVWHGCTATKPSSSSTSPSPAAPKNTTISTAEFLKKIEKNALKVERLNGDADIDYQGEPMNISASSNIRYRKDSLIWMNVKKLGFNVVRAQITRDSVFVINYVQSNVMRRSLKYLEQRLQIPVSFDALQRMLLGQPVFMTPADKLKVTFDKTNSQWVMTGADERWQTEYRFSPTDFLLQSMTLEQPTQQRVFKLICDRYDGLKGEQKFAYSRTITIKSPQTGEVKATIETAKPIEVDIPKAFKFDIPPHSPNH
jgi:hypothetical protein